MRPRRLLLLAGVTLALVLPAHAVAAVGPQKVLVIRATWGPQPFDDATVRDVVFGQTSGWLQSVSFGQSSLGGDITPWLPAFQAPQSCHGLDEISMAARAAASAAGFDPGAYDKLIYLLPRPPDCGDTAGTGELGGNQVWLFGYLYLSLVVHELGHTFGLPHASTVACTPTCAVADEYGDPFSTMGGSKGGQFNGYEKAKLGWLTAASHVVASGDYTVDQLEQASGAAQALVIDTARNEYWLDHREPLREDAPQAANGGVLVHAGPVEGAASDYPRADLLLPDPAGKGRPVLLPGESWGEPGVFSVNVLAHAGTAVTIHFAWTDATAPGPPVDLVAPHGALNAGSNVSATWQPAVETGSGIDRYEARLDGAAPVTVAGTGVRFVQLGRPAAAAHLISVVAIDRAGNRGTAATSAFTVVKAKAKPVQRRKHR